MRRLLALALCAGAVAAPIPVAHAKAAPDIAGQVAAKLAKKHLAKAARARAAKRRAAIAAVPIPPQLEAIAACESGGNPRAIGGGGLYRGAFQMSYATWASVGGQGDPAAAPMAEQVRRAAILYAQAGPGQWPVCGA
jgi:hypothetical protein